MCLDLIKGYEKTIPQDVEYIYAYKVVKKYHTEDVYRAPYMGQRIAIPGTYVSNRRQQQLTDIEICTGVVSYGVHVFLDLEEAKEEIQRWTASTYKVYIVKCKCLLADLVAEGIFDEADKSAVFMKVETVEIVFEQDNGETSCV